MIAAAVALISVYLATSYLIVDASLSPTSTNCPYRTPLESNLQVEPLQLRTSDGIALAGWLLPSSSDRAVVLVHGLGSFAWDAAAPDIARALVDTGFSVLVFDLRAHGQSGGERVGLGWQERLDVQAAVDALLAKGFRPGSIGLLGTSYGAATAIVAAAQIPEVGAIVADSAFADAREVMDREIEARTGLPEQISRVLRPGLSWVARTFFELNLAAIAPERAVQEIAPRPTLFIHGEDDSVIPVEHSSRLMRATGSSFSELWTIPGLDHTEGVHRLNLTCSTPTISPVRDLYIKRVTAFFDHSLARPAIP